MKTGRALLELFTASIFWLAGLFFLVLPYQEASRLKFADALLNDAQLFVPVGATLLGIAAIMTFAFYRLHRGRFFVLRMGDRYIAVDPFVISQTLRPLLRDRFPGKAVLQGVDLKRQGILQIRLALAEPQEASHMLSQVEQAFQGVLAKQFGYRRPFIVVLEEI